MRDAGQTRRTSPAVMVEEVDPVTTGESHRMTHAPHLPPTRRGNR